jgi:hypothetical protein
MEELGGCDLREVWIPSVDRDGSIAYMPRSTPRKAFQLKERLLTLAAQKRQAAGPNNANRFAQRFCSSASVAEASYEAEGASNAFPSRPLSLLLPKRPQRPPPGPRNQQRSLPSRRRSPQRKPKPPIATNAFASAPRRPVTAAVAGDRPVQRWQSGAIPSPPSGENLSSPGTYHRVRPDTEGEEEEEEEDEEPEQIEPPTDEERTLVTAVLRAKDKLKQQIIRRRL